ncbi:hypothetical protein EYF80_047827 [Liparis tanakae]|uniref:Uncharacterized protein n=1 Tax=Liparis tanakae TaxID=230148 RepID=A0A4Z2FMJ9_9TELE|nr:hypothetical protein EYF80_047827 [Liparis tanakae]
MIRPMPRSHRSSIIQSACFSRRRGDAEQPIEARREQEVRRGQQEVPWLRRGGSKNSRKLLYFEECAEECKKSAAVCFCPWSEPSPGRQAAGCEESVTLCVMCLRRGAGTRMFVANPPRLSLPRRPEAHALDVSAVTVPLPDAWMELSSQGSEVGEVMG